MPDLVRSRRMRSPQRFCTTDRCIKKCERFESLADSPNLLESHVLQFKQFIYNVVVRSCSACVMQDRVAHAAQLLLLTAIAGVPVPGSPRADKLPHRSVSFAKCSVKLEQPRAELPEDAIAPVMSKLGMVAPAHGYSDTAFWASRASD